MRQVNEETDDLASVRIPARAGLFREARLFKADVHGAPLGVFDGDRPAKHLTNNLYVAFDHCICSDLCPGDVKSSQRPFEAPE